MEAAEAGAILTTARLDTFRSEGAVIPPRSRLGLRESPWPLTKAEAMAIISGNRTLGLCWRSAMPAQPVRVAALVSMLLATTSPTVFANAPVEVAPAHNASQAQEE